jgi:hypothetical protein
MSKIVKSSSSTEKAKLETLYSPNKGSPEVIKSIEDSENSNNKRKLSTKTSFWGSPDLSPGIEKLYNAMNLSENSKSLIISINLCNIKYIRDSSFQDTIIKVLCLGKSFLNLIKENHGLNEDDVIPEHMIPTTFNEETELLSDSNTNSLKRHYMTFYWKVRIFLDYIEDSMSQDTLIGSTISTRSKKSVSWASKISSPSVLSHDTKTSKVSEKTKPYDFYPKNFNHAFLPKPDFEGYRNNTKKQFEEHQNYVGDEEFHQEPDHPSTFMKMVKELTRAMSAVNDERRQVLPSKVIWNGPIDRFEVFRNNVEGHYGQIGAGCLIIWFKFPGSLAYLERVLTVMLIFWMKCLLLPRSRRMPAHCMAHYLVHARVV